MAFTYRNVVQRPLSYAEHDENLQTVEQLHDGAVAARDAAVLNSGIFADTAAGLAGTSDGDFFSVPSTDENNWLLLYRNDNGSADLIKTYVNPGSFGTAAALDAGTDSGEVRTNAQNESIFTASATIRTIWHGTQAAYDGLTPDANTLYLIVE